MHFDGSYVKWWTPKNLVERSMPEIPPLSDELAARPYCHFDDYWLEYYRPKALSSFLKVFTYNLNSTLRYIPVKYLSHFIIAPSRVPADRCLG